MTQLRGLQRFGSICGSSLVVSAMAKIIEPTFALVESGEKCVIVKINDVGPLRPGRVIDLNERSMRYFDPTQQLGLISDVKVTLLRR